MLVRDLIAARLRDAVGEAQRTGALPEFDLPQSGFVERPQKADHGDFASGLPLRVAKAAKRPPLEIAHVLADALAQGEDGGPIGEVSAAPPGFVNFRLSDDWLCAQVESIRAAGETFGNVEVGGGRRVQIEFVSVNPTGPVHVGHARGAVLGSGLARALAAAGFDVTREYYVNDAGNQMELFYRSVFARYAEALGRTDVPVPEDGYQGAYLVELGKELAGRHGLRYLEMDAAEATAELGEEALNRMLDLIRTDLDRIGVGFDVWFRERDLYADGQYEETMALLRERGYTAVRDGAEWFTSSALGDEKDNVIVRSTGAPTYFASDIAYHRDKFGRRGFDRVIDIWGADHQGHVPRMKAVMQALDLDPDRLTILIGQLVTLKSGGDIVRASKRTGQIVTLGDLVDEVGADACRYFFLARAAESQMEFDLELAKRESSENPVYYVQYAHARIAGILRQAAERGVAWDDGDTSLLTDPAELALVRRMLQLPEIIDSIAVTLAPHSLPHYAVDLATAFHWFYDHCRVLSSDAADAPLMKARLKLTEASRVALARTLALMGMSAPETM
ncbi:MAG: arginine--tRNA ligase [Chloroflexi bacterium]|nr:arginine--tRNA ligase [Chloroflexota bacterium]MYF65277.1 arginine--tRNA ligase [Chloroflexota bacterium]MYK34006.1 arginine--tRNA ligase [Chloroflexota bacterium]